MVLGDTLFQNVIFSSNIPIKNGPTPPSIQEEKLSFEAVATRCNVPACNCVQMRSYFTAEVDCRIPVCTGNITIILDIPALETRLMLRLSWRQNTHFFIFLKPSRVYIQKMTKANNRLLFDLHTPPQAIKYLIQTFDVKTISRIKVTYLFAKKLLRRWSVSEFTHLSSKHVAVSARFTKVLKSVTLLFIK